MGTIIHRAVIAEMPPNMPGSRWGDEYAVKLAALTAFRESLPGDDWRALVVGPVKAIINGSEWVLFLPDGSKEWWDTSDAGDAYRDQFLAIFPDALVAEWGECRSRLAEAGQ
jgi:hypothetical protein